MVQWRIMASDIRTTRPGRRYRIGSALTDAIREQVDPDELIQIALSIARGEAMQPAPGEVAAMPERPSARERIQALQFLADRGYGKPAQEISVQRSEIPAARSADLSLLSVEELRQLQGLWSKAAGEQRVIDMPAPRAALPAPTSDGGADWLTAPRDDLPSDE